MPIVSGFLLDGGECAMVARSLAEDVRSDRERGVAPDPMMERLAEELGVIGRAWRYSIAERGNADDRGNADRNERPMRRGTGNVYALETRRTCTTREAAEPLGVKPRQIRNLAKAGVIDGYQDEATGSWVLDCESIDKEVERRLRARSRERAGGSAKAA